MAQPVNVVAIFRLKEDKIEEARPHLKKLAECSRDEKGVDYYNTFEDVKEKGTFVFIERYSNEEVFETHQKTDHFNEIFSVIKPWLKQDVEIRILKPENIGK